MNLIADMYYSRLPAGPPTQGDVWSGLPAWAHFEETCTGLLITPRCDLAHDNKTPVINYLPIITMKRYLLTIGAFSQINNELARTERRLRQTAEALQVVELFDVGIPPDELIDSITRGHTPTSILPTKKRDKQIEEFRSLSRHLSRANELLSKEELTDAEVNDFTNAREIQRFKEDLVNNKKADTYFLPPCPILLNLPSLVLLHHIYTCPIEILSAGGDRTVENRQTATILVASKPQRIMRLRSPYIEDLLSRFASLFTRVGVRDLTADLVSTFTQL